MHNPPIHALPPPTALTGVTVVPMDRERVLPNQTVLIDGGRITALGPADTLPIAATAQRIDGVGRYLMPGLADMHVHLAEESDLSLLLANGVTTVRNMLGRPWHLDLRERINRGDLLGPTIVTAGPILDAPPTRHAAVTTPEAGRQAVAEHHAAGYDFVKVYNNLDRPTYDAIISAAAELGMPVDGHVPRPVGLMRVLAAGQRSIEHLIGYVSPTGRGNLPGEDAVPGLAAATRDAGVWNCPTLVLREQQVPEGLERVLNSPVARFFPPERLARWQQSWNQDRARATLADWETMREANRRRRQLTKALHDAGARLLLGTDTLPGFSIHDELGFLLEAGLTPYAALRCGTAATAEFLGTPSEFGVVAPGARADLLLLSGNPLADVRHVASPLGVMVRGHWLPRTRLDAMLEEITASHDADGQPHEDASAEARHGSPNHNLR